MEIWKDIEGWEGWYQVSNQGRVRSLTRVSIAGGAPAIYQGKVLAAKPSKNGYPLVTLTRPGFRLCKTVHTLVMLTFVGKPPEGLEACHNNGIRTDCCLENLRYDTRSANSQDRKKHGTYTHNKHQKGNSRYNAILTEDSVRYIREHPEMPLKQLGKMFGVHFTTIHYVRKGNSWTHI